jgi:hypothetical protein
MARDRHKYGPKGEYLGKTSDRGPNDGIGCVILIISAIIVLALIKSC